jgi:hypothetical protein
METEASRSQVGEGTSTDESGESQSESTTFSRRRWVAAAALGGLAGAGASAADSVRAAASGPSLAQEGTSATGATDTRLAALERQLDALRLETERAQARGAIENVFNRYQFLHTAFRDPEIITDLWVKKGTPGISAQYTNTGVYTTWDSVMAYHRNRPNPVGKLLVHINSNPVIEVAADGASAKGLWIMSGVESGLTSLENAKNAPEAFFEPGLVDGKKVWAHWVQCRYGIDLLKQDGQWRIWHFRCVEISRAPFSQNWIAFAATLQGNQATQKFHTDLAYFGDDGKPVFMPPVDAPPKSLARPYQIDQPTQLEPPLPKPFRTFSETFQY